MSDDYIDLSKQQMVDKIDYLLNENGFKTHNQKVDMIDYFKECLHFIANNQLTHEERKHYSKLNKESK